MPAARVRLGCARVPGQVSRPDGATKIARLASPSIPSQLVSANESSGSSGDPGGALHSHPFIGLPSVSNQPSSHAKPHTPPTHAAATCMAPASGAGQTTQSLAPVPQCIGLVRKSG